MKLIIIHFTGFGCILSYQLLVHILIELIFRFVMCISYRLMPQIYLSKMVKIIIIS